MKKCSIKNCDGEVKARGLCNRHWIRNWRNGTTFLPKDRIVGNDIKRFESHTKLHENTGCLIWQASNLKQGYGTFWLGDRKILAHRAAWVLYKGEIPDGLNVLHKCDNRLCVNHEHLFLGTQSDNLLDMYKKGRR